MKISINLELSSLDQVRALEAALTLYVDIDMETDRLKDDTSSKDKAEATLDRATLAAARQVLLAITTGSAK